jgi:hypothetical protein
MKCIFCDTDMKVELRRTDHPESIGLPGIAWCPSCLKWWHVATSDTPKPEKVVAP